LIRVSRVACAALLAVAFAGCGGGSDTSANEGGAKSTPSKTDTATAKAPAASSSSCRPARSVSVNALQKTLAPNRHLKLSGVYQLRLHPFPKSSVSGFKSGVFVASAGAKSRSRERVLSWVVNQKLLRDGGGVAIPVDATTRRLSRGEKPTGASAKLARAVGDTLTYRQTRRCVRGD
jgi:hypothetical protein